jgi:hypothetical protein
MSALTPVIRQRAGEYSVEQQLPMIAQILSNGSSVSELEAPAQSRVERVTLLASAGFTLA